MQFIRMGRKFFNEKNNGMILINKKIEKQKKKIFFLTNQFIMGYPADKAGCPGSPHFKIKKNFEYKSCKTCSAENDKKCLLNLYGKLLLLWELMLIILSSTLLYFIHFYKQ